MDDHRKSVKIAIDDILQKVRLDTSSTDELEIIQNNKDVILYIINELKKKFKKKEFKYNQENFKRARNEPKELIAIRIRYSLFLHIITRIIYSVLGIYHDIKTQIHVSLDTKSELQKHVIGFYNDKFFDYETYFGSAVPAENPVKSTAESRNFRNQLKKTTPSNEQIIVRTYKENTTRFVRTMKEIAEQLLAHRESIMNNNKSISKNDMKSFLLSISKKITRSDLNTSHVNDTLEHFTSNGSFNKQKFMEFLCNELERDNSAFRNLRRKQNVLKKTASSNEVVTTSTQAQAQNVKGGKKVRKSTLKKNKKVRKHKGIYQTGPKKGKLKPGFKYSGKKTKTGLKIIIKVKK